MILSEDQRKSYREEINKAQDTVMPSNNKIGEQEAAIKTLVSNGYFYQILRIMLGIEDRY